MSNHCFNLSLFEAAQYATSLPPMVLVKPVKIEKGYVFDDISPAFDAPSLDRDKRRWAASSRHVSFGYGEFDFITAPCAPGDVAVLRERWRWVRLSVDRDGEEWGIRYLVDKQLAKVDQRLVHHPLNLSDLGPQHMPAVFARHHRPVVSVNPSLVREVPWQYWFDAGFRSGGARLGEAEDLGREEWVRHYGERYPWDTSWAWVIGLGE